TKPHPEERAVARVSKDAPHTLPHSRDRHLPEFCKIVCASSRRGRREDRVRAAPAVSCAMGNGERRTRADRFGGNTPAFPAQWFDGLCRALPGDRLFDTIAPEQRLLLKNLTPALGASGPHGFAGAGSRRTSARFRALRRGRAPTAACPHVRDVRERPSGGTGWGH